MLLRICLIVAILAGLGAGGLGYYEVSTQIPALTTQRDTEKNDKNQALTELATTKNNLKKTQGELAQTKQDLADTRSDRDKAVIRADQQEKLAAELSDKLAKANQSLDDAKSQLAAYTLTGLKPEQILQLNKQMADATKQIAAINGEKAILQREYLKEKAIVLSLTGPQNYISLPADLKGKILVVDPKWDFVVLNIGDDQGVIQDGEMLVSREGKLVAKVIVRNVEKDRSIANIVPGWKLGELFEGDEVTPAHPAS